MDGRNVHSHVFFINKISLELAFKSIEMTCFNCFSTCSIPFLPISLSPWSICEFLGSRIVALMELLTTCSDKSITRHLNPSVTCLLESIEPLRASISSLTLLTARPGELSLITSCIELMRSARTSPLSHPAWHPIFPSWTPAWITIAHLFLISPKSIWLQNLYIFLENLVHITSAPCT